MKESEELKAARIEYLAKLTKYGGLPMPATAHYTQGYKDGSAMLWAVAQTCAEAERRLEEMTRQRDLAVEVASDAATSLETIQLRSFGEESYLDSKPQMRAFAGARAKIAREVLSTIKESEGNREQG